MRKIGCVLEFPNRGGFWVRFRRAKTTWTRYGAKTKAAAERKRMRVQIKVEDGDNLEDAIAAVWKDDRTASDALTFRELAELYLANPDKVRRKRRSQRSWTDDRVRWRVEKLRSAPWARCAADAVDEVRVRRWIAQREAEDASDAALLNDLSQASAIIKAGIKRKWIADTADNPFLRCRPSEIVKKRRPWLDLDELRVLFDAVRETCPIEAWHIIRAACVTGWRLGDLALLHLERIDPDYHLKGQRVVRAYVRPEDEKQSARKVGFLPGETGEYAVARCGSALPSALLFTQANGRSWEDPRRVNHWIRKAMGTIEDKHIPAWKKDGDDHYTRFSFHCFRHTVNTLLLQKGTAPHVVAALLGHAPDRRNQTLGNYAHVDERDLLAAARVLDSALRTTAGTTDSVTGTEGT